MKKYLFLIMCLMICFNRSPLAAQEFVVNYDESKVPAYTLPDPLVFNNGDKVLNEKDWERRRAEILKLFEDEVYGMSPVWKGKIIPVEMSSKTDALGGTAIRREIQLILKNGSRELSMVMLLYLPKSSDPVPVFLGYNFGGNHSVTDETGILVTPSWMRNNAGNVVIGNKASEAGRGRAASAWQVKELISRGIPLMCCGVTRL